MKTLSQLKTDDTFYLLYFSDEGNNLLYVTKHRVGEVKITSIGRIIYNKNAPKGEPNGITIETKDYDKPMASAFCQCKIFSDKDTLLQTIEQNKQEVMRMYDNMIKIVSE